MLKKPTKVECLSYPMTVTPALLPEICLVLTSMMQWLVERMGGLLICLVWVGTQLLQEGRTWNWYLGPFSQFSAFLCTQVAASMSGTCDQTCISWKAVLETSSLWIWILDPLNSWSAVFMTGSCMNYYCPLCPVYWLFFLTVICPVYIPREHLQLPKGRVF